MTINFTTVKMETIDTKNENDQKLNQNQKDLQINIEGSLDPNSNAQKSNNKFNPILKLPQNNYPTGSLFERPVMSPFTDKELLKQMEKEKKIQDKLNQIRIDLVDLGFPDDQVQDALQKTNFYPEVAFDILYKNKKESQESIKNTKYNYSEIYNNYEEKEKKIIDEFISKYGLEFNDAVEAFESCNRNDSLTEEFILLLK